MIQGAGAEGQVRCGARLLIRAVGRRRPEPAQRRDHANRRVPTPRPQKQRRAPGRPDLRPATGGLPANDKGIRPFTAHLPGLNCPSKPIDDNDPAVHGSVRRRRLRHNARGDGTRAGVEPGASRCQFTRKSESVHGQVGVSSYFWGAKKRNFRENARHATHFHGLGCRMGGSRLTPICRLPPASEIRVMAELRAIYLCYYCR
jgi:hypothetical protein